MKDVTAADGVPRHHRNDGLGTAPDLHVQIRDVEAPDRLSSRGATRRVRVFEVSGIPAHLLVPPEQKASGPSPVRMMTPVSWSSRASSIALCISMTVRGRKAFLTSGRFMVIFAIPSAFSYLMSSNSPADSHSIVVMQLII